MWNKIIGSIREADAIKIEVFGKLIEKKFEKTIDENIKPSYTINSDRGNPSDLWNNLILLGDDTQSRQA